MAAVILIWYLAASLLPIFEEDPLALAAESDATSEIS